MRSLEEGDEEGPSWVSDLSQSDSLSLIMDRGRKAGRYPWLTWKVRFFLLGASMAIAGMAMAIQWLVAIAIVILCGGFLIRFLPGGRGEEVEQPDPNLNVTE